MNKSTEKIQLSKHIQNDSSKSIQKRKNLPSNKNNSRQKIIDSKVYGSTQIPRKKFQPSGCNIPSPRAFFKRSRSRQNSFRLCNGNKSNEIQNFTQSNGCKQPQIRAEYTSKLSQLKKRVSFEIEQKEKLRKNIVEKDGKLAALGQQILKLKQKIKWYQQQLQKSNKINQEKDKQLVQTQLVIQTLNKIINSNKSHTKKQFKYVQSKEENILCKIQKLIQENAELSKQIQQLKFQNSGKKTQTVEQDKHINKETAHSLQLQINRLKKQLQKDKSERQKHLQLILRQLQSKLYEKQNDLRKNSVHINLMGRKHTLSIDEVRQKKDQEIRYLRQKFLKVSKDLKQIKNKIDKNEKKKVDPSFKKVKSSKNIMFGSDTDDLTFELSSEV